MVLKPFDNSVLNGLCSKDQLDLLDSVDRLRSQGIDHYVSLPQIIVCGDQSSGKSSVLEAISGVSFPVKSNLCTRFPTELILRKTPSVGVSVSIVPDQARSNAERASLSNFRQTLDSFDTIPTLIDNAKTAMAIGTFGRAFSKDLLRIEISGPDRPHLTIVDLPGLIHSETKQQSADDVELVQDVVRSYMTEPRSIILAVVSAKNDYANQIVLKLARSADKTGTRTLGVITKPDTLVKGSESEAMYIKLAQNLDVEFRLGWHVLRNMDSETGSWSLRKRDDEERRFFSEGSWPFLPGNILGIAHLRERLSKLLLGQIAAELPSLIDDIEAKSTECRFQLQKLGEPRAMIEEQRFYLLNLGQTCQTLIKAAVDGTYTHDFFGDAKPEVGYQRRIRAVVQNMNQSFAESMAHEGHHFIITESSAASSATDPDSKVGIITRAAYLDRIESLMKRTRGRELPGTFNPMIISDLFLEQSQAWESLARSHIVQVAGAVKFFLKHLVSHLTDISTGDTLFHTLVEPALESIFREVKEKTTDLLTPHQRGHPITYNQDFVDAVQKVKKNRMRVEFIQTIKTVYNVDDTLAGRDQYISDFSPLLNALTKKHDPDLKDHACSEALDCMQAYYKVAYKRFLDDIAVEAVEKNIIAKLNDILAPTKIAYLADDKVESVAGESAESRSMRKQLTHQLNVLIQGLETCKTFIVRAAQGPINIALRHGQTDPSASVTSSAAFSSNLDAWLYVDGQGKAGTLSRDPQDASSGTDETVQTPDAETDIPTTIDDESFGSLKVTSSKKKGKKGE